jgi:hypothetical protein
MMNEPGKSDRPAVPEKSPNNARRPAAEGTEGRGLAKGNLLKQNASRTPSRTHAPSALSGGGGVKETVGGPPNGFPRPRQQPAHGGLLCPKSSP